MGACAHAGVRVRVYACVGAQAHARVGFLLRVSAYVRTYAWAHAYTLHAHLDVPPRHENGAGV